MHNGDYLSRCKGQMGHTETVRARSDTLLL